jgi:hypothetical protein
MHAHPIAQGTKNMSRIRSLKADRGYVAQLSNHWPHEVRALDCQFCGFSLDPRYFASPADKSSLERYNRARSKMIAHLVERHRDRLSREEIATAYVDG